MALKWSVSPDMRLFLITGILGGFTTFSAFSLEVVALAERGAIMAGDSLCRRIGRPVRRRRRAGMAVIRAIFG